MRDFVFRGLGMTHLRVINKYLLIHLLFGFHCLYCPSWFAEDTFAPEVATLTLKTNVFHIRLDPDAFYDNISWPVQ